MASVFNRGTRDKPKWYAKIKEAGSWKMFPTHQPTKVLARKWAEEREAAVAQGKPARPEQGKTFGALATYWLENHSHAQVSHRDNVSRLTVHLLPRFGATPLVQITAPRIDEFKAKMGREIDPTTGEPKWKPHSINRVLALLRKILNDGERWEWLDRAPKVRLLSVPETQFDYLTKPEAERFLSWARQHAPYNFPLYFTAIYTGMRMGELMGLHWADVDLAGGLITVRRSHGRAFTKSKRIRRLRVGKDLAAVLTDWRAKCPAGDLVFPNKDGTRRDPSKVHGFQEDVAAAIGRKMGFHSLRHTCASLLIMSGASMRSVQAQLGHSSVTTTERYAHLAPSFMSEEADRLNLATGVADEGPSQR